MTVNAQQCQGKTACTVPEMCPTMRGMQLSALARLYSIIFTVFVAHMEVMGHIVEACSVFSDKEASLYLHAVFLRNRPADVQR